MIEIPKYGDIEDFLIKMVIVGNSGVGKSNILSRYVYNQFDLQCLATVGIELGTKIFKIEENVVRVNIWDTAGQERYKSMTYSYYKGARGAMIVFDITDIESFKNVDRWYKEIKEYAEKDTNIILIGNKSDLTYFRKIKFSIASEKADELGKSISIK
jgi:small GTP-binding protein